MDKLLHHPDILTFLKNGDYHGNLVKAEKWLRSGRPVVVRYDDLHSDSMGTPARITDRGPTPPSRSESRSLGQWFASVLLALVVARFCLSSGVTK